jgi:hypothetical protein
VTFGLRAILLIVAIILFLIATGSNDWQKLVAIGLACTAGALLVGELGLNLRFGGRRRR